MISSCRSSKMPGLRLATFAAVCLLASGLVWAIEPPHDDAINAKAFTASEFTLSDDAQPLSMLPAKSATLAEESLLGLKASLNGARVDAKGGRFETLLLSYPLISEKAALGESKFARGEAAGKAFLDFLSTHQKALRIATSELGRPRVTVHDGGRVIQIYIPRFVGGIAVKGSYISAVVNHGKINLFGTHRWGDIDVSGEPSLSAEEAYELAAAYMAPHKFEGSRSKGQLLYVPTEPKLGQGYGHRLVWNVQPTITATHGSWDIMVDAHSGKILGAEDTNHYAEIKGGVLPVTNDGIVPDGVEQLGWPMPFQDIVTSSGTQTTDTGGNVNAVGSMTADFFGPYVNINDNCGSTSLTQNDGIDWGGSSGTDCATPGFGGAGNTHASRTGFYELNKIIEMGRGQLPSNSWLQSRLTSNMNINQTCNAFWNGTVNFYRSGGGCFNTGEIAGVFDHEWGHGMDANDATPGIAGPSGEGIADIYTALRLNDSCIGRNFRATVCTGFGDPCLTCTGVRDIDYLKRQSGQPHDYSWSNANCGGSVHCVGSVYSEAVWSLWKRNLQSAPYNYDNNTAHEIVNRLTYIGAGAVGTWFSGGPPFGGCGSSGGYLNYLAADDDNGNLNDGTPHMQAIFDAFNDQEIACSTPTVQESGCAGTPTAAPSVSGSSGNQQVSLNWNTVAGASSYEVYRTEGVFACDFGKVKLGATSGTSWNDTGLQNGRDYSYIVIPKGSSPSCFGPASSCTTVQPVGQPDFNISCTPDSQAIAQGQGGSATCTVISSFGYTGNVGLSCAGNPAGIGCSFSPASVSPPSNGSANSTLTLTVGAGQATGNFTFDVNGNDGTLSRNASVTVQVIPAGSNGPQDAVYDSGLGAPKCSVAGSECDSTTLLDSRNSLSPSEPNQPNTLDVCNDGTAGTYHSDESNDRIVVSTLDGGNFTEGDTVEIAATVWAWSTGTSDTLDLYYAADANNPSWVFITSIVPPGGGAQTLTAQYTLPAGSMQAVRANFRYQGSASPCSTGTYDDHDDLVFTVESAVQCTVDADCDDGAFCNGDETCNAGQCEAGTAPVCDDGAFCNGDETCNEATDSCDAGTPPACDDGAYCNGTETCNESTDSCDAGTAPVCDDGSFCNGTETCNESTDSCDAGTAPCDPGTETCNEGSDICEPIGCTTNADCDDGAFCNGAETCNVGTGACEAGTPPVCDDGAFCNGTETCNEATDSCDAGTPPACDDGAFCNGTETCNEATDSCDAGTPPACDDGAFCNGTETCNEATDSCDAGTAPCSGGQTCDEVGDQCTGGASPVIWMSFRSNTAVPGVGTVTDEDIVSYDEGSGLWQLEFDGSDVGLGSFEIDGLAILSGGDLLLSFRQSGTIGGISVDDSDVVRFTPTSLGSTTAGTFSLYFDGSDVGLTSNGEDVDGITLDAGGNLVVSTQGGFSGTGASGADEDLFTFSGTLGPSTSGSFTRLFDGSDVGLGGNGAEDVDAATLTAAGNLLISTVGSFSVTGLTGSDEDIAEFSGTFGNATSGTFSMRQDLSTLGIATGEDIGSMEIIE